MSCVYVQMPTKAAKAIGPPGEDTAIGHICRDRHLLTAA